MASRPRQAAGRPVLCVVKNCLVTVIVSSSRCADWIFPRCRLLSGLQTRPFPAADSFRGSRLDPSPLQTPFGEGSSLQTRPCPAADSFLASRLNLVPLQTPSGTADSTLSCCRLDLSPLQTLLSACRLSSGTVWHDSVLCRLSENLSRAKYDETSPCPA